ncbi:hypothetical protein BV375_11910 [Nostoc sp. 106C]|nr:hypothetical protein BV375_11910 [Nostoc sp. 106C]
MKDDERIKGIKKEGGKNSSSSENGIFSHRSHTSVNKSLAVPFYKTNVDITELQTATSCSKIFML